MTHTISYLPDKCPACLCICLEWDSSKKINLVKSYYLGNLWLNFKNHFYCRFCYFGLIDEQPFISWKKIREQDKLLSNKWQHR